MNTSNKRTLSYLSGSSSPTTPSTKVQRLGLLISKEQHAEQDEQVVATMNDVFGPQNGDPLKAAWLPDLLPTIVDQFRNTTHGEQLLFTYATRSSCVKLLEKKGWLSKLLQEAWSKKKFAEIRCLR